MIALEYGYVTEPSWMTLQRSRTHPLAKIEASRYAIGQQYVGQTKRRLMNRSGPNSLSAGAEAFENVVNVK